MNKLTKIGITALCGSLAATFSAHAGDLSVTGGADMTWISKDDETTGNPIGIGSNLTFKGSGELDNGWSVALTVAHTNANAYSNTNVVIGIPGVGDIRVDQGTTGTGIDRMDDKTPSVWEEAWGTGLSTGIQLITGVSGSANLEWTPEGTPDGLTARVAYSPKVGSGATVADGTTGGSGSALNSGIDITLEASDAMTGVDGLSIYGGLSMVDQSTNATAISGDKEETTVGFTYAMGGFTFGYQWSEEDTGRASTNTKYDNNAYGVTFSVNDDLSIGYNHYESEQNSTTNTTLELDSIQVAYTMGGATITIAEAEGTNMSYQTTAAFDRDMTTVKLALAF
jgi:outer membrane protein OmpU